MTVLHASFGSIQMPLSNPSRNAMPRWVKYDRVSAIDLTPTASPTGAGKGGSAVSGDHSFQTAGVTILTWLEVRRRSYSPSRTGRGSTPSIGASFRATSEASSAHRKTQDTLTAPLGSSSNCGCHIVSGVKCSVYYSRASVKWLRVQYML